MSNLALVPLVGALLLVALMIFITSRRAQRVAEVRGEVEWKRQQIIRADVRNDEQFVESLLSGVGMDRAVTHLVDERSKLLPGVNPEAPAAWSIEQLKQSFRDNLQREIEGVNRGLFTPALGIAVLIVGVSCVTAAVLYQFHSGPSSDPAVDMLNPPSTTP